MEGDNQPAQSSVEDLSFNCGTCSEKVPNQYTLLCTCFRKVCVLCQRGWLNHLKCAIKHVNTSYLKSQHDKKLKDASNTSSFIPRKSISVV